MKTPRPLTGWLARLALLSILNSQLSIAQAQGTAFTYQGRLNDGTNAANGFYDLRFGLHDTSVGGHGVIGLLTNSATPVSNGLFTVTLDFGSGVFAGDDCWLGMGVRTNGGDSFTTLSPRQQLTATPYAILASGVGAGDITASMLASGAVTSDKIAVGAVKGYQIDDGGSAAYEGFQGVVHAAGGDASLPFASLFVVSPTNGVTPTFSLTVNGETLGTLVGFSGSEGISRPYAYVAEVQSSNLPIDPEAQLGRPASLTFTRNGRTTSFGGIVTACALSSASGDSLFYTVRIESPLAYLALTTDYRVNQNLRSYEVASTLYRDVTGKSATLSLSGSYPVYENLIQYAETDLNFFSRLLEYEGIFYFFNQSASPPSLILGDDRFAYLSAPNSPFAYYGDTAANVPAGAEYIRSFQKASHQSTQKSTAADYSFQHPGPVLSASHASSEGVGEHYEFRTLAATASYLEQISGVRVERQEVEHEAIAGSGTAPDLRPGYTFALADYAGVGVEGTYLVTEVRHAGFVRVTNGVSKVFYGNLFQVIPSSTPYRPALQTPKPLAQPCTAVVTGPDGEEIYVDDRARVKVQFHWDRIGSQDQNSSAWLRMTSPMASSQFRGMMFLPRIGDEVLVSFIQGDPDQPVVTSSLYNAENPPPYALPASKTVSTIRSTGSKSQPGQINEIMFDDLAGKQELRLKAAKDMNLYVAQNLAIRATNDLMLSAANDLSITVAGNLTVRADNQMTLTGPLTLTGNLYLPNTTAGAGGIYFGSAPVIQSLAGGDFFAGPNAGNATMSGSCNTAVGAGALDADTTGGNNTAYGYGALGAVTTGGENTASGVNALYADLNGNQNVAHGAAALFNTTSGSANTANGYEALFTNGNGSNNTASGYKALFSNTTGTNNIALGYQSGYNITGNNNLDLGHLGATSDNGIIRLGTPGTHTSTFVAGTIYGNGGGLTNLSASALTGSASNLTLTGALYLPNTTSGAGGVYFGGAPVIRSLAGGNFFAGLNAGNAAMSGNFNTAVGATALDADTSGANNTAYGYGALGGATTGSENTACGVNALNGNLNGNQNVADGAAALISNSSGSANTANGYEALFASYSGSNNTADGYKALYSNSTGNNNIALGYQSGYNITGNNNIDLGNPGTAADNGVIRLGTPGTHFLTYLAGLVAVSNSLIMNDQTIQLRGDLNHGVGWYGVGKLFGGVSVDGPVVFGYSGGGLGTLQTGTATNLAVYWNTAGNVGIGTNNPNQKLVVAGNIYATGTITPNSDHNQKTGFAAVDSAAVLAKVAALPIQQWRFKAEDASVKHVGPMAQDFHAAFGLGEIPTAIATVDADGVALAAIQGLNQKLEETRAENAALKARLDRLEHLLGAKHGGEL